MSLSKEISNYLTKLMFPKSKFDAYFYLFKIIFLPNIFDTLLFQVSVTLQCRDNPNNPVFISMIRGGSRTASASKMEHSVIIVNGCKPITIITKSSI